MKGPARVLDVGLSNGAHLVRATTRCASIVGVGYDVRQLAVAASGIRAAGLRNALVSAWDITRRFPLMPVVLDTPLAGAIDAVGGLALRRYDRLSPRKREAALRRPGASTGFRARARKASP